MISGSAAVRNLSSPGLRNERCLVVVGLGLATGSLAEASLPSSPPLPPWLRLNSFATPAGIRSAAAQEPYGSSTVAVPCLLLTCATRVCVCVACAHEKDSSRGTRGRGGTEVHREIWRSVLISLSCEFQDISFFFSFLLYPDLNKRTSKSRVDLTFPANSSFSNSSTRFLQAR